MLKRSWSIPAIALIAGTLLAITASSPVQAAGPVKDELGVVTIPKGAPITVGGMWVISGADTALGTDSKRGAEQGALALVTDVAVLDLP